MPKKSKAQKLRAVQRVLSQPDPSARPESDAGRVAYWGRRDGIRFLISATPQPSGGLSVRLCCIDEIRDGVFKCMSAEFETGDALRAALNASPVKFARAEPEWLARSIEFGVRINRFVGRPTPEGFEEFVASCGELPKVALPPGVYACPISGAPLPADIVEKIKLNAESGVDGYYISDRYQARANLGPRHPRYAMPMHLRYKNALLESAEFSLTPPGWDALERAVVSENFPDIVGLAMTQDVARGIVYCLEKFVIDATAPNPQISDAEVLTAFEKLKASMESEAAEPPTDDSPVVAFLLEMLDEGVALCKQIFLENTEKELEASALVLSIDACIQGLQKSAVGSGAHRRSYVDFLCAHLR
jgi:hypothetical protein